MPGLVVSARPYRRIGALPLIAVCLGYFMVILDATALNVALPALGHDLGTSVSGLQWVVDSYTLVFAAFLLFGGSLGDRLGSRTAFGAGMILFTAASAACAASPATWFLVCARLLQGLGAALAVPASLSLLRAVYSEASARARAFGVWGGVAGIAAASGPVLGGLLAGSAGWRAVFFINVPIGLTGLVLTSRYVPSQARNPGRKLDVPGQVICVAGLVALTLALIGAGHLGWSAPPVMLEAAVFVVAAVGWLARERRAQGPMLPLSLFQSSTFSAATAVGFLINLGFYGQLFVINLYFQQVRGFSPLLAGIAVLPQACLVSIGSILSGRLTGRSGPRLTMLIGLALGGAGVLGLSVAGAQTPYWLLVAPLIAAGFGMSFTMPAATTAVVEAVSGPFAGVASGVINSARQVGSAVGVALLGSLVAGGTGFITGLRIALPIAAGAFLVGWLLTLVGVYRGRTRAG